MQEDASARVAATWIFLRGSCLGCVSNYHSALPPSPHGAAPRGHWEGRPSVAVCCGRGTPRPQHQCSVRVFCTSTRRGRNRLPVTAASQNRCTGERFMSHHHQISGRIESMEIGRIAGHDGLPRSASTDHDVRIRDVRRAAGRQENADARRVGTVEWRDVLSSVDARSWPAAPGARAAGSLGPAQWLAPLRACQSRRLWRGGPRPAGRFDPARSTRPHRTSGRSRRPSPARLLRVRPREDPVRPCALAFRQGSARLLQRS